jgi:putative transposase
MTIARNQLIDVSVTRWYHGISRCVRGALLLRDGAFNRKEWIESRIEELARIFAVGVGGFSVMDNHLHLPSVAGPLARRWLIDANWPV